VLSWFGGAGAVPTDDELNLVLTQTEWAIQQYKPLIDQEEAPMGEDSYRRDPDSLFLEKEAQKSPMDAPQGTVPKTPPESDPRKENRNIPARSEISPGPAALILRWADVDEWDCSAPLAAECNRPRRRTLNPVRKLAYGCQIALGCLGHQLLRDAVEECTAIGVVGDLLLNDAEQRGGEGSLVWAAGRISRLTRLPLRGLHLGGDGAVTLACFLACSEATMPSDSHAALPFPFSQISIIR
jgi:hypothetical protein